jgi:tetratricopeptide (TPR) repeat protein
LLIAARLPVFAHLPLDEYQQALAGEIAHNPGEPELYIRQAQAYRIAHQWEAAFAAVKSAVEHGAHSEEVTAERGMIFLDSGRPREAIAEFDKLLGPGVERPMIRYARGRAWMDAGESERAASDYGRAVEKMNEPTPDHVLAWRDALLAAGHREAALDALDRGMRRVGVVPSLQLPAVDLALGLNRLDDAIARLDTLLRRNPGNEAWLLRKGEILQRAGRNEEARQSFILALTYIEARPAARRGERIRELERQVRTSLASLADGQSKNGGNL